MAASMAATTRLCGLIGDPVAHSYSPAMHNAAFAHLGLDYAYAAMRVAASDVPAAIDGARALGFAGLNVTAPHKEAAFAVCEPDELARAVGAVNTITFSSGACHGANTDVYGVERAIDAAAASPVRRAVLLGAGGAARAVVYALARREVELQLCARRAHSLTIAGVEYPVQALASLGALGLAQLLGQADLIVDATPLGHGEEAPPWPLDAIRSDALVLDLVVRAETPLTRACAARGLRARTGAEMLLHQGAAAFERFTSRPAPVEVMRDALQAALRGAR